MEPVTQQRVGKQRGRLLDHRPWLYGLAAASFIIGGATVFAAFLGTATGCIAGAALIAAGVAFVIFAVF